MSTENKKDRNKMSPLYTSADNAVTKRKIVGRLGKDKDGAYRVANRIDKQS